MFNKKNWFIFLNKMKNSDNDSDNLILIAKSLKIVDKRRFNLINNITRKLFLHSSSSSSAPSSSSTSSPLLSSLSVDNKIFQHEIANNYRDLKYKKLQDKHSTTKSKSSIDVKQMQRNCDINNKYNNNNNWNQFMTKEILQIPCFVFPRYR